MSKKRASLVAAAVIMVVTAHYHADEPVTFSRATEGSNKLIGKSDANMGIRRSVTGKAAKYGGAIVMCRTQLQHSIASLEVGTRSTRLVHGP